jgi:hypothetical protein
VLNDVKGGTGSIISTDEIARRGSTSLRTSISSTPNKHWESARRMVRGKRLSKFSTPRKEGSVGSLPQQLFPQSVCVDDMPHEDLYQLSQGNTDLTDDLTEESARAAMIGMDVDVPMDGEKQHGKVLYCGFVDFQRGLWVGIALDNACGVSDGIFQGIRYFRTLPQHAIMVPYAAVAGNMVGMGAKGVALWRVFFHGISLFLGRHVVVVKLETLKSPS